METNKLSMCDYLYKIIQHHYYNIYWYKVTYDLLWSKTLVNFAVHKKDSKPIEFRFPLETEDCDGLDLCIETLELAVEHFNERKYHAKN